MCAGRSIGRHFELIEEYNTCEVGLAMHEISQFKTTLYIAVLLGLAAFGVAAQAIAFWAVCSAAVLLHAWLSSRGKFRPLSRMYANLITIGALLYVIHDYMSMMQPRRC